MPSHNKNQTHPGGHSFKGFSLLELLVVIACLGLLLGISMPAVNSISRGKDATKTANDIAGLLDLARSYAKSSNVRVEVGFSSDASGLQVAVISAREGTSFTPISRIHRFPQIRLASVADGGRPVADLVLAETRAGFLPSFEMSGRTFDRVIEFNSRGEARALTNGLARRIEIGLLPNINGATPAALQNNSGTVQVAGLSGGVAVYRP